MDVDPGMQTGTIGGAGSGFNFSGKRIEHLAGLSSEWTLATVAVDATGSVLGFNDLLRQCLMSTARGCQLSPRRDYIMLRALIFNSHLDHGVEEIHGFKPVNEINPDDYPEIIPDGYTTLNDACYSSIGASNKYGEDLRRQDYNANGILVVITDGGENASTASQAMVKSELESTVREEKLESMVSILVGINAKQLKKTLEAYQRDTGIDHYIDAGEATPDNMAKLAGFISQSVSSQSQHVGTGGPSQIPPQI
jgi:hypothetical protein